MRKKTICAMMTGFLAVQGIEVHAETQQMAGDAASAVESVELEADIIENNDVTDADGKAESEEPLWDEKPEEEPSMEEEPEQEPELPEEKTDPEETGKEESEGEEEMLPPTVIPDPEKESAEKWEEMEEEEKESSEDPESEKPEELPEAEEEKSETEKPDFEESDRKEPEAEKPDIEETKQETPSTGKEPENQNPETKEPEKEEPAAAPAAGPSNTEKQEQPEPGQSSPEKEEPKTAEQPPAAAAPPKEVTQDPDNTPLQTEESSPLPAEIPSESAEEKPSQIPPQIIADFILSQTADEDEDFEAPNPLILRPADTSFEVDPGYTPEILLEGASDTTEILSCMINGSEAEYEWKENKICLKAESLSEGYNRITVKVRDADGMVRTMKPWEVNVKPKSSTLVSKRTSQKPKGTRLWQSLRHLWKLIRAIAEIQNQTTRYLRALCRK